MYDHVRELHSSACVVSDLSKFDSAVCVVECDTF